MPSLDVVNTVDMQTLDNAVNNVKREVATRYDFRNVKSEITLDRKEKRIHIVSGDESKVKAVTDMLIGHCARLKVDPRSLSLKKIEIVSLSVAKMDIEIKDGIPKETCQKIVKLIKGLKTKVQPTIQENQVRLTAKQIDDLQEVMRVLDSQDYDVPLQYVNMKR